MERTSPEELEVIGLDRHRNGSWHPPRGRRDKVCATFTVGPVDLFGLGFTSTAHRHIPKAVCSWLRSQGIDAF